MFYIVFMHGVLGYVKEAERDYVKEASICYRTTTIAVWYKSKNWMLLFLVGDRASYSRAATLFKSNTFAIRIKN